jgi:hypothetical protein
VRESRGGQASASQHRIRNADRRSSPPQATDQALFMDDCGSRRKRKFGREMVRVIPPDSPVRVHAFLGSTWRSAVALLELIWTILSVALQLLFEPVVYLFFDDDQPLIWRMVVTVGFVLVVFVLWRLM